MKWEYKRVLFSVKETIQNIEPNYRKHKRYYSDGNLIYPDIEDSVEARFNQLGAEGWELVTAVNLDSGAHDFGRPPVEGVIEYIFKKKV